MHFLRINWLCEIYNKSIYILLFVNWVLYILYKSKMYHNLEYAYTHIFRVVTYLWLPSEAPHSLTTRPPGPAAATRPLGQVRSWWAQGSTWKLQARGREGQCLQWGLSAEWPSSIQGLYLFLHQPKAFDPSLKSKDRKKDPLLPWGLAT